MRQSFPAQLGYQDYEKMYKGLVVRGGPAKILDKLLIADLLQPEVSEPGCVFFLAFTIDRAVREGAADMQGKIISLIKKMPPSLRDSVIFSFFDEFAGAVRGPLTMVALEDAGIEVKKSIVSGINQKMWQHVLGTDSGQGLLPKEINIGGIVIKTPEKLDFFMDKFFHSLLRIQGHEQGPFLSGVIDSICGCGNESVFQKHIWDIIGLCPEGFGRFSANVAIRIIDNLSLDQEVFIKRYRSGAFPRLMELYLDHKGSLTGSERVHLGALNGLLNKYLFFEDRPDLRHKMEEKIINRRRGSLHCEVETKRMRRNSLDRGGAGWF